MLLKGQIIYAFRVNGRIKSISKNTVKHIENHMFYLKTMLLHQKKPQKGRF